MNRRRWDCDNPYILYIEIIDKLTEVYKDTDYKDSVKVQYV